MRYAPVVRFLLPLAATGCGDFGLVMTVDSGSSGSAVTFVPEGRAQFGDASPDGRGVTKDVKVGSASGYQVQVTDAWVEGDEVFEIDGKSPFPTRLASEESVAVTLRFLPTSSGDFRGTFVVEDSTGTLTMLKLTGTGCRDGDGDGDC
jgi:hypothetical protein